MFKHSDKKFSINLSIEDIINTDIWEYIFEALLSYNHIGKRVVIKLDGSLIKHIDIDKNARILVETIVSFAKRKIFEDHTL